MKTLSVIIIILSLTTFKVFSQKNSNKDSSSTGAFQRISESLKNYKPDTTTVPDDKITTKIIELRNLRGGFNINEAIAFKLEEDRQKNEKPKEELDEIERFFTTGDGKRWLDNSVIWIYRNRFDYKELKQLVKFYKTTAGQKIAADFPIIMLQSLQSAEMLKNAHLNTEDK